MTTPSNISRRSFAGLSLAAVGAFALTACNSQAEEKSDDGAQTCLLYTSDAADE